jgi:hypothetical protein
MLAPLWEILLAQSYRHFEMVSRWGRMWETVGQWVEQWECASWDGLLQRQLGIVS